MNCAEIIAKFSVAKASKSIDFQPKKEQIDVASAVINGKNVAAFLPTGFGKSFCYVLCAMLLSSPSICLIISPLITLMEDQMIYLHRCKFTCAKITSISDMEKDVITGIESGKYEFVFASPESVQKPHWRSMFLNETWQSYLKFIVIDEAHCMSEWGNDFRPEYKLLSQLQSFFNIPLMIMTATCTMKVKDDIFKTLNLNDEDTTIVFKTPDRPNIFLCVQKRDTTDLDISLKFILQHLKKYGKLSKKTIIYCRSIDMVAEIFISLKDSLGNDAYIDGEVKSENIILEMFHSSTHDSSKNRILNEFKKVNSNIRCLIATVAIGMGIDIPDIESVIHVGCPKSVLSYWQEAGRCARDGRDGLSFVLYDNFTASSKSTEDLIADIIRNKKNLCYRQQILEYLSIDKSYNIKDTPVCPGCNDFVCKCMSCNCCSFCKQKCQCEHKMNFDSYFS